MIKWLNNLIVFKKKENLDISSQIEYFRNLFKDDRKDYLWNIIYNKKNNLFTEILPYLNKGETVKFNGYETDILFCALDHGALTIAEMIVQQEINNSKFRDGSGNTPLMKILKYPEINFRIADITKKAIEKYKDQLNEPNYLNEYPLNYLIDKSDYTLVEQALKNGAKPFLVPNLIKQVDKEKNKYGIFKFLFFEYQIDMYYRFLNPTVFHDFNSEPLLFKTEQSSIASAFNIKNKAVLSKLEDFKFTKDKKINITLFNMIYLVKKSFPYIDDQLLLPLIKFYENKSYASLEMNDVEFIIQLFNHYSPKRIIKLLSNFDKDSDEYGFLKNAAFMFKKIKQVVSYKELILITPKKPKSFKQIQDVVKIFLLKMEQQNEYLNQGEIISLDGFLFGDYTVVVPKSSYELIMLGTSMNNCVGNGFYSHKINSSDTYIISLNKNNKPYFCLEFNSRGIVQARGFSNTECPSSIVKKLDRFLIDYLERNNFYKNLG